MASTTALRVAIALLAGLAGCVTAAAEERPPTRLLLTGSSTMAPLMAEIAKRFEAQHRGVRIEVQTGGSGRGIADARQGKADIGMVSRALTEAERDLYGIPIARDGVAVVVHRSNPVAALSNRQLADIYAGKIANWRQVGGRGAPIVLIAGPPERGSSELLTHYLGLRHDQFRNPRVVGDNAERIAAVAAEPEAIVYLSVGEAEREARSGRPIKLLPVEGVAASSGNVRKGDYPISRPLTLVTKGTPAGAAREFIEFCLSAQVTDAVLAFDFVPYLD